ncbi:hypothetical protein AB0F15_19590 [Amycolatopsis sp. NPDC026612]|uniref:hypothetical protein n=1 Tax=Amycolatopsis sp. NPDC026612 TaxID=3155466 RepID=UPI0034062EC1
MTGGFMPPADNALTAAIIGSFRQFYEQILEAWQTISASGITITSPLGSRVITAGIPFIRFESDDEALDDAAIQTLALHRILRADLVYVVAPTGYIGRTTCYEIGRIIQAGKSIYFSELPKDLPLRVNKERITTPSQLVSLATRKEIRPLYADEPSPYAEWERRLLTGDYLDT